MIESEVARLLRVFLWMTDRETRSFIFTKRREVRGFTRLFAGELGVDISARSEITVINLLQKHLADLRIAEEPEPEVIPEPEEPVFECMGCGDLAEGKGLRWKKIEDGEALTVSIDNSGKPETLSWLTDEMIMKEWFKPWTDHNPRIRFELLKTGKGDCHIQFAPIDGPNGTLAFVWQPSGNAEYMEASGDLSGDMTVDSSETVWPVDLVHEAGQHESGHVIGIGHLLELFDVMFPSAKGEKKSLSVNDKREADERHPQSIDA